MASEPPKERLECCHRFIKDRNERIVLGPGVPASLPASGQPPKDFEHKSVRDLKQLSMLFRAMFEEIPYSQPTGQPNDIVNYDQLLVCFDSMLDEAPVYDQDILVALPFTVLLEWPMATRGGLVAFLNQELNLKLGAVLDEWGRFLKTKRSREFVVNEPNNPKSWLGRHARRIMQLRDPECRKFEDLYKCPDPLDRHLGFESWDHFFTREFLKGVREVKDLTNRQLITNGCESAPYAIKQQVKLQEEFWIKGQPYSLSHMLDSETDARRYTNGTIYQAFLSPLTYHRWHSPITGHIKKIRLIQGSYFSVSPVNSFPDPEVFANTQSQAYLSSVATRAVIHLENEVVKSMVMIAIGMVDVSTCEINHKILEQMKVEDDGHIPLEEGEAVTIWKENGQIRSHRATAAKAADLDENVPKHPKQQDVTLPDVVTITKEPTKRSITYVPKSEEGVPIIQGHELGMFHFGGSTHCLIFPPEIQLQFRHCALPLDAADNDNRFVPLNAVIAEVLPETEHVTYKELVD